MTGSHAGENLAEFAVADKVLRFSCAYLDPPEHFRGGFFVQGSRPKLSGLQVHRLHAALLPSRHSACRPTRWIHAEEREGKVTRHSMAFLIHG